MDNHETKEMELEPILFMNDILKQYFPNLYKIEIK